MDVLIHDAPGLLYQLPLFPTLGAFTTHIIVSLQRQVAQTRCKALVLLFDYGTVIAKSFLAYHRRVKATVTPWVDPDERSYVNAGKAVYGDAGRGLLANKAWHLRVFRFLVSELHKVFTPINLEHRRPLASDALESLCLVVAEMDEVVVIPRNTKVHRVYRGLPMSQCPEAEHKAVEYWRKNLVNCARIVADQDDVTPPETTLLVSGDTDLVRVSRSLCQVAALYLTCLR